MPKSDDDPTLMCYLKIFKGKFWGNMIGTHFQFVDQNLLPWSTKRKSNHWGKAVGPNRKGAGLEERGLGLSPGSFPPLRLGIKPLIPLGS